MLRANMLRARHVANIFCCWESFKLRSLHLSLFLQRILPTNYALLLHKYFMCCWFFSFFFFSFSFLSNLIKCANCFRAFSNAAAVGFLMWARKAMLWICLYTLPLLLLLALTCYASAHTTPTHTMAALLALHLYTRTTHFSLTHTHTVALFKWERGRAVRAFNSIIIVICWHLIWFLNFN